MQRVRIGIIGTGASVEWAILPALLGPDALSPPDTGAWWSRRPAPAGDIRFQAPATPEIVALGEGAPLDATPRGVRQGAIRDGALRDGASRDGGAESPARELARDGKVSARLETLGRAARGAALFASPRALLRQMSLDALLLAAGDGDDWSCAPLVELAASAPGLPGGVTPPRWVWIDGPPARSLAQLDVFARAAAGGGPSLWIAAPLKRAAAHRAARRLIERDGIGEVTAIQARFPFALDEARFGATYAAFDLLLSFVPGGAGAPRQVSAARHPDGAASVLLQLAGGATVSALFGAADSWNSPLPRLEICGTQGRFLTCEAGRRLWHHVPREAARLWEPPGLAPHVSSSNVAGYAEDLKAFLAVCTNNPAPFNAERALDDAARALGTLEATFAARESGQTQPIEARGPQHSAPLPAASQGAPPRNLTLELG